MWIHGMCYIQNCRQKGVISVNVVRVVLRATLTLYLDKFKSSSVVSCPKVVIVSSCVINGIAMLNVRRALKRPNAAAKGKTPRTPN